ncbi:MAG: hypothetical protein K9M75_13330 [Phycisphaerae bacterium]|nr:hypothetical protein [Phycisphaerae bacterium]
MLSPQQKRTIIVCISLLAMTLSTTILAETIGQKIIRLQREKEQGKQSDYDRSQLQIKEIKKPAAEPEKPASEPEKTITEPEASSPAEPVATPIIVPSKPVIDVSNSNDPLNLVPADALFCVRINNFGDALSRLDQFLLGVIPMMPPLTSLANTQIANIIGNPTLSGINFDGNVIIFTTFDLAANEATDAILAPVTSYEEFVNGHPNCSKPDADGFRTITSQNTKLDKLIIARAPGGKYAYITGAVNKATMLKLINSAKTNSMVGVLTANEKKLASTAPLWAYGNLELIASNFKPKIRTFLKSIPKLAGKDSSEIVPNNIGKFKSVSLTLNPSDQKLTLGLSLTAKQGTELANLLVADPTAKKGFGLTGYLKKNAIINLVVKINKPLRDKIIDLIITSTPPEDATIVKQMADIVGSEMASSLSFAQDGMSYSNATIFQLNDPQKASDLFDLQYKKQASMQNSGPMKINGIETFNNTRIYLQERTIARAYPISNNASTAVSSDKFLYCTGSLDEMKKLINKSQVPVMKPSGDIAKALQIVNNSDNMDFIASLNLLRLVKLGLGSKAASSGSVPLAPIKAIMISELNTDFNSCMAIAGKFDSGRADLCLVLPKDHLMEIFSLYLKTQMKMQSTPKP